MVLELTAPEATMVQKFLKGEPFDPSSGSPPTTPPRDKAWNATTRVRADVVSGVLLGRYGDVEVNATERFVVRNCNIIGRIDLGCGTSVAPFLFEGCSFSDEVFLSDAELPFAGFSHCTLNGILAKRVKCTGPVWLNHSTSTRPIIFEDAQVFDIDAMSLEFEGSQKGHVLCLCGATIDRDLSLGRSRLPGTLGLVQARIGGTISLRESELGGANSPALTGRLLACAGTFDAAGARFLGSVELDGTSFGGHFILNRANLSASDAAHNALVLDHAHIKLGFHAKDMSVTGSLSIHHAEVACQVALTECKIEVDGRRAAIRADHIKIAGALMITGSRIAGSIDLHGAEIECNIDFGTSVVTFEYSSAPAVSLLGVTVRGSVGFVRADITGAVYLSRAKIGGALHIARLKVRSLKDGRAVIAHNSEIGDGIDGSIGVEVSGVMEFDDSTIRTGVTLVDLLISSDTPRRCLSFTRSTVFGDLILSRARVRGTVDLAGVQVSGDVRLADAVIDGSPAQTASRGTISNNEAGPWRGNALRASRARIAGDLDCAGAEFGQSVNLTLVNVGRQILFSGATLKASHVPALAGRGLCAEILDMNFQSSPLQAITLSQAKIGTLRDSSIAWREASSVQIDGLQYRELASGLSEQERGEWLAAATKTWDPQPYLELSSFYRRIGSTPAARTIEFEFQRRRHQAGTLSMRVWGMIQNATVGFGYKPSRAVLWLAALIGLGTLFFSTVPRCAQVGSSRRGLCPINPSIHPSWNPLAYALERAIPLINLGQSAAWNATGLSRIVATLLTLSGALLAVTIIAAVTRNFRRT